MKGRKHKPEQIARTLPEGSRPIAEGRPWARSQAMHRS